jgi:hypothetical protein
MRLLAAAVVAVALGVRVAHSRHRRFLHPDGRSFAGSLEIWGADEPLGAALLDRPGGHDVTVRVSKGKGTRGGRADIRGLAIRVHGIDLLFSSTGTTAITRRLPVPRRSFDTVYGTITPYRTGDRKLYLEAVPDPAGPPLGRSLEAVPTPSALLLRVRGEAIGRVALVRELPAAEDAELAFDPIRNTTADLHPTGTIHGVRAFAYRASQRWRGATPARPNPAAVARTNAHR